MMGISSETPYWGPFVDHEGLWGGKKEFDDLPTRSQINFASRTAEQDNAEV